MLKNDMIQQEYRMTHFANYVTHTRLIENARDFVATSSLIIEAAQTEIVWRTPPSLWVLFASSGIRDSAQAFMAVGGSMRGITHVTHASVGPVHTLAQAGAVVRHATHPSDQFMLVGDARESISALWIDPTRLSLDSEMAALWINDPHYARRLLAQFEAEWTQAIDSTARIAELLDKA